MTTQTDPVTYREQVCQCRTFGEHAVQTEDAGNPQLHFADQLNFQHSPIPDPLGLERFLSGAERMVSRQLLTNAKSEYALLEDYEPGWPSDTAETEQSGKSVVVAVQEVVPSMVNSLMNPRTDAAASSIRCLAWNHKGTQLAVGYGNRDHRGWCSHRGFLSVWNFSVLDRVQKENPDFHMEMESCVTSVVFHPTISYLVAVGTYAGEDDDRGGGRDREMAGGREMAPCQASTGISILTLFQGELLLVDLSRVEDKSDVVVATSKNAKESGKRARNADYAHFETISQIRWQCTSEQRREDVRSWEVPHAQR